LLNAFAPKAFDAREATIRGSRTAPSRRFGDLRELLQVGIADGPQGVPTALA